MSGRDHIQDLVVLFDPAGATVARELRWADFEQLRQGLVPLPERANETVRAAYVTVEPGLRVAGLAFFLLPIDAAGWVPASFNVPLRYLVEHAGVRADLGVGPVHVASRAQCPVPWVALKLWEPDPVDDGAARQIQRIVVLNRLGLSSSPTALRAQAAQRLAPDEPDGQSLQDAAQPQSIPVGPGRKTSGPPSAIAAPRHEIAGIEHGYLEQIRKFRSEVHELKAALRMERERNRRLQALLRGEV